MTDQERKTREYMAHLDTVSHRHPPMNKSAREIATALRTDPSYEKFSENPRAERGRDILKSMNQIAAFIPFEDHWREFLITAMPGLRHAMRKLKQKKEKTK